MQAGHIRGKTSLQKLIVDGAIGLLGLVAVASPPAWGAERIQFIYGPFESTIQVEELEAIAAGNFEEATGFLSQQLTQEQLEALQSALNRGFDIDLATLSQLTYTPVGENLLNRIGQVVQTDSFRNGWQATRAALILARANASELTLLEVVRAFPLETIQLDLPLLLALMEENQHIFQRQVEVVQAIQLQAAAEAAPGPSTAFNPRQPGPYSWQLETLEFKTPGRSAPSAADLYLPETSAAPMPALVISHGVASNRSSFQYLAEHLASHGYAVVVPEHIDSSSEKFDRFVNGLEGPPQPQSLVLRPQDVTAVLDELEGRAQSDARLARLDLQSVGVIGHSLGGYTALAVGGAALTREGLPEVCANTVEKQPILNLSLLLQCRFLELPATLPALADDRIQAVLAINPLTSHIFGESGLSQMHSPAMVVASTHDYFVPALPEQIQPFRWMGSEDKYLVLIHHGTHFSALDSQDDVGALPVDELMGPNPEQAQMAMRSLSLAFFNRHLLNQADHAAYLNQTYLDALETSSFQFSILVD